MRFLKSVTNVLSPKLVWIRITSSKWTLAFFCTVVIHCLLQLALEGFAYANNYKAITFMERIINAANPNTTRLGVATFRNGDLIVCGGSPWGSDCEVVWSVPSQQAVQAAQGTYTAPTPEPPVTFSSATLLPPTNAPRPADSATATVIAPDSSSTDVPLDTGDLASSVADNISQSPQVPSTSPEAESEDDLLKREIVPLVDEGAYVGVLITDEGLANKTVLAGNSCVSSLQVPLQNLMNSRRVDLTFMIFQVWVLGMSVVALLNESVPHIIAAFVTHIVATLWSAYQVHQSYVFRQEFNVLVVRGPCKINILPNYWGPRAQSELAVLIINIVVTLAVGAQSYKLLKNFGWQTFKKIGASLAINRCYQLVLAFSIVIQLAVFFVGANIALWLDQLCNGAVSSFSTHRKLYEGIYISTAVILVPWLAVGWLAVRSEQRVLMGIFLGIAAVMITGWASMFASRSFLFTFNSWDFFAWMTCAAAVLLVATIVLGIVCRLNFGKGLPEYLVREQFNAEPEWEPAMEKGYGDEEKVVQFPSEQGAQPIPTFSEAFVGPEGLDRLRAMSKPAARRGPGIGMHAREPSADVLAGLTEVDITGAANVTLNRSASVNSQSTLSSVSTAPGGQPVMRPTDSRYNLTRINTSESYRSTSTAATADRMNRNRRVIE